MSFGQWLALLALFVAYLVFGGAVFMVVESPHEETHLEELDGIRQLVYGELIMCDSRGTPASREDTWAKVAHWIEQPELIRNATHPAKVWTFYNSFFVAVTAASTIGYGHMAPTTSAGRLFCILFALFGIPLNGILFASLGDYFGSKLSTDTRSARRKPRSKLAKHLVLLMDVGLYLVPGLVVFLAVPAALFSFVEGWTYVDALYFAFTTLSTIGFGDMVPGTTDIGRWTWLYRVGILTWIIFGLGYLVMVLNIITKGLRSKPVVALEKKMARRFRATRSRVLKDALLLRQLVNEIQVLNIKPTHRMKTGSDSGRPVHHHREMAVDHMDDDPARQVLKRREAASCRPGHGGLGGLGVVLGVTGVGLKNNCLSDPVLHHDRDCAGDCGAAPSNASGPVSSTLHDTCDASTVDDPVDLLARLATALIDQHSESSLAPESTGDEDDSVDEPDTDESIVSGDGESVLGLVKNLRLSARSQCVANIVNETLVGGGRLSGKTRPGRCSDSPVLDFRRAVPRRLLRQRSVSECHQDASVAVVPVHLGQHHLDRDDAELERRNSLRHLRRQKSLNEFRHLLDQVRRSRKSSAEKTPATRCHTNE